MCVYFIREYYIHKTCLQVCVVLSVCAVHVMLTRFLSKNVRHKLVFQQPLMSCKVMIVVFSSEQKNIITIGLNRLLITFHG